MINIKSILQDYKDTFGFDTDIDELESVFSDELNEFIAECIETVEYNKEQRGLI
jgi:hypothetical protein